MCLSCYCLVKRLYWNCMPFFYITVCPYNCDKSTIIYQYVRNITFSQRMVTYQSYASNVQPKGWHHKTKEIAIYSVYLQLCFLPCLNFVIKTIAMKPIIHTILMKSNTFIKPIWKCLQHNFLEHKFWTKCTHAASFLCRQKPNKNKKDKNRCCYFYLSKCQAFIFAKILCPKVLT